MTVRLYLETNFLLSHALGRDPATSRLIQSVRLDLQIAMPIVCVMEALAGLEQEERRTNAQEGHFKSLRNELGRSPESPGASQLLNLLTIATPIWGENLLFFRERLVDALGWLETPGRVDCLMTPATALVGLSLDLKLGDPTDALILATILSDAATHPATLKVLVTENSRCFHQDPKVRKLLAEAGIRYFARLGDFLQWHEAGGES